MNDGIAGQAFWTKNCANCGKEMDFPTTDADDLCLQCAKELDCCKHCGAKMDSWYITNSVKDKES